MPIGSAADSPDIRSDSLQDSGSSTLRSSEHSAAHADSGPVVDQYEHAETGGSFGSRSGTTETDAAAGQIREQFANQLRSVANDHDAFHSLMRQVYGESYNYEQAEHYRTLAQGNDTSWLPQIEFVSDSTLQGAYGAYDANREVVYLNEKYIGNTDFLVQVYSEEFGHFLDTKVQLDGNLRPVDTMGDEGEMFRRVLAGEDLSASEINAIRSENDHHTIVVDGKKVKVEFFLGKIFKGIGNFFKGVGKALKGVWDGFMDIVNSQIFSFILGVMMFIPGLNVIAAVANAALAIYNGVKTGNWMGAAMGVAGAFTGGAASAFGKMAGKVAQYAATARRILTVADAAIKTYQAARQGDIRGVVWGLAGAATGAFAKGAGQLASGMENIALWAQRAQIGIQAWSAAQSGDLLGAVGIGSYLAGDIVGEETEFGKTLQNVSQGALRARSLRQAVQRGNYVQAASMAAGMLGEVSPELRGDLEEVIDVLEKVGGAERAIRNRDFGAAANLLMETTGSFLISQSTKAVMREVTKMLESAERAFKLASEGHLEEAARVIDRELMNGAWDRETRSFLQEASKIFTRATGIDQMLEDGRYVSAAWRLGRLGSILPGEGTIDRFAQAIEFLRDVNRVSNDVQDGDWRSAGDTILRVLGTNLDPAASAQLRTATNLLDMGDDVVRALDSGNYLSAANTFLSRGPWDGTGEGAQQVRETIQLFRDISAIGDAVQRGDWQRAMEGVQQVTGAGPNGSPSDTWRTAPWRTPGINPMGEVELAGAGLQTALYQTNGTGLAHAVSVLDGSMVQLTQSVFDLSVAPTLADGTHSTVALTARLTIAETTADQIRALVNYSFGDWRVGQQDEQDIVSLLAGDTNLAATIVDLESDGTLGRMLSRVDELSTRREMIQILGSGLSGSEHTTVANRVRQLGPEWEAQFNLASLGVSSSAPAFDPTIYSSLISSDPTSPFTGVGATGVNPTTLSIPPGDLVQLGLGDASTTAEYKNPLGSLPPYLTSVGATDRVDQARLLLQQEISSVNADSFDGNLPSRAQVIEAAAAQYDLEPELIAAFLLAEQRDQSRNEDAADFTAATLINDDTSIGLGQVVVRTAENHDLFSDLLSSTTRGQLSHDDVARLLASDEYNIFAAAKYIRSVADDAAALSLSTLPNTQAAFPSTDMGAFGNHSSTWTDDNIRALASEYTSAPWDDHVTTGWGNFVLEAYRDVQASGVF